MSESFSPSSEMAGQEAFKQFEHKGWQSVADGYHDHFAGLTMQTIQPLLDAVDAQPGNTLLDVATGPGYVAKAAASRGCVVTGLDFSSVMVARARVSNPGIAFVEGDAENLPFDDKSFDLSTMNFGLLHLSNPDKAIEESHRILKVGGRAAFTVWALPSRARAFGLVLDAIEKHGARDVTMTLPAGPPFFKFSDAGEFERAMQSAGFKDVSVQEIAMTWELPSPSHLFEAFFTGTPRTGGILRAQPQSNLEAIRIEICNQARQSFSTAGEGLCIPMASVLGVGRRA